MKHHYTNAVSIELKELISDLLKDQLSSRLCNFIYRSLESPTVKFLYMQFHRPEYQAIAQQIFCVYMEENDPVLPSTSTKVAPLPRLSESLE